MDNYSILMTVYKKDSPDYFQTSVESMLSQTVRTNDFVLVCDGELTPELNERIEKFLAAFPMLFNIVRLPTNVGLGAALKKGVPLCKNEIIARMDDDDIAHPDRCETELIYLQQHPEVSLIGSYVSEFDNDPSAPLRIKHVPTQYEEIKEFARKRNPFNHSTVMFRRTAVIDSENYSEMRTNQDVDLWVRMLNKGFRCENISRSLVDFRFDNDTYKRRKQWKNVSLMITLWKRFCKAGYCSYADYIYVTLLQIGIFVMPQKILKWAYDNFR